MNRTKKLRLGTFTGLLSVVAATRGTGQVQESRTSSTPAARQILHFMVLGDWGTGQQPQREVAEAMAQYAVSHRDGSGVQFVISVGDNFYEDGVSGIHDPVWNSRFEQMYDRTRLPMPFISVLGNHDWRGDAGAEIAYRGAHPGTRWQMDGFWFKRSYPAGAVTPLADFFYLDTDLWSYNVYGLADTQLKWLKKELQSSRARWQIVVGHHPLYSNGDHGKDNDVLKVRALLSPLFKQWGVDAYLCGHDHDLQRIVVPEHPTLFLISGAGAKLRPRASQEWGPFYASTLGFLAITLSPTEMTGQFVSSKGKTLHTFRHVPAPAVTATAGAGAGAGTK